VAEVEVGLLGPLRLRVDGRDVDVPGRQRRAALAVLALAAGRTVTVAGLVDALWSEDPPASARNSLQSHLSRLRGHLAPYADRLRRVPGGYRLDLSVTAVDAHLATAAADQARERADDPSVVARLLDGVLGTWRGPALGEFDATPALAAEAVRLEELRLTLLDLLLDARLRSEPAAAVVDLASRAAAEQPLRETTRALLVRALAGSSRAADALEVARDFRRHLDEETGLVPTAAFEDLERAVAAGELGPVPAADEHPAKVAPSPATGSVRPMVPRHGLPTPLTPVLGRDDDLGRLLPLLQVERCLTLVGPGGVGKTRLAYELATRAESGRGLAPDGVVVVELAQVQDPRATGFVLAELLGVRGDDLVAAAVDHLADRRALVVLDNCEHVVDAVRSLVRRLLGAAPQVHVLATSREPLGVPGEWVHRLSPLPVPPPGDPGAAGSPAVRLFRDRASRATGGALLVNGPESDAALERVAEVCRHLDGLPLALELAAAWLPAVGLAGLRDRLDHRLDIGPSRSVGDDRHGTLRRTIAWSYDLLTADEQRLFRHLCVVPDRFEVELAEHIAATVEVGDHPSAAVSRLVDCSMVVADPTAERPAVRVLESLRAYGLERLEAHGETDAAEQTLCTWVLDLSDRAAVGLAGPEEPEWDRRLVTALPTLRAARRAMLARADLAGAARLSAQLGNFALWREHSELWAWALETAELSGVDATRHAAPALAAAASGAWRLGLRSRAKALVARVRGLAADDDDLTAGELVHGVLELFDGRFDAAERDLLASPGGAARTAEALATVALSAGYSGRREDALRRLDTAERLAAGGSPTQQAYVAYVRGEILALDASPEATVHLRRAVDLARESRASFVEQVAALTLATVAAEAGDVQGAVESYRAVVDHWRRTGSWTQQWTTLRNVAVLLAHEGMTEDALMLVVAADAAADSSALAQEAAVAQAQLVGRLRARLGPARAAEVAAEATVTPRADVVDAALSALDRLGPRASTGS
jgi:predicted ATPase/DNA-binding SARP family transcriptional activator